MTTSTKHFSAATFPLSGRRLIEASAGTGKTYNIANLYLRLLLGAEGERTPLPVNQILVVTFTRAATNELRGRIRDKIELALRAFRHAAGDSAVPDAFVTGLLTQYPGHEQAARLLNAALVSMDEAAIFTIHGFAVRAIKAFLFETGALADVELSEGDNARKTLLLADAWRQLQMSEDPAMRDFLASLGFKSRDEFTKYYGHWPAQGVVLPAFQLAIPAPALATVVPQCQAYVASREKAVLEARAQLATRWQQLCAGGEARIKAQLDHPKSNDLLKRINDWLKSSDCQLTMPGKTTLISGYMQSFHTSGATDDVTVFIRDLLDHVGSGVSKTDIQKAAARALLLQWLQAALSIADLAAMQLDEVVGLVNRQLQAGGETAAALRRVITASYPVCMVDEFQDTDPEQFAMFNGLYGAAEDTGFFMIGDPKQSIYAFRGADIFSYLGVRQQVEADEQALQEKNLFSLDTNFRSKQSLVAATNALFADTGAQPAFVFPGIPYEAVHSCEGEGFRQDKGVLRVSAGPLSGLPAMVFVGNPAGDEADAKRNGETLRWQFARDTAQRIAALLDPASAATIEQPGKPAEPVRARDIAILVRTGTEARILRKNLMAQTPPIGSVYQSQRDSVFSSALFAEDIYHILRAMDDPANTSLIKAALVTPLFRALGEDFSLIDAFNSESSDAALECWIAEFSAYQRQWSQHGVLSALNVMMTRRELAEGFARQPDGDRLITDFRHLGELLQQHSLECGSREQLLIWYARQLHGDSELDEDSKRIRLESDENLVKIVTIHVSKGLEYPVVFLPFFFLPRTTGTQQSLPLYHDRTRGYQAVVDFSGEADVIHQYRQQEALAEDMRLLYVAVTRAVYQCVIGISAAVYGREKKPVFPSSVWAHLLDIHDEFPTWSMIDQAIRHKLSGCSSAVALTRLFAARVAGTAPPASPLPPVLVADVVVPDLPVSSWVITSYSALAHAKKDPGLRSGGSDEVYRVAARVEELLVDDRRWQDDIRYRLRGSSKTGDCLHALYEQLALEPARYVARQHGSEQAMAWLVRDCLRRHGLETPEHLNIAALPDKDKAEVLAKRCSDIVGWINSTLDTALLPGTAALTLRQLMTQQQVLPELAFDFALGKTAPANIRTHINPALRAAGADGIHLPYASEMEGLMTGSIDLLFLHDKKIYLLDYKSNTLGKAPRCYDTASMTQAMVDNRYDLQYLIYAVAAHRYMQQRLGDGYAYDGGEYCFGGVFYLFVRGMGLPDYPEHGIWFHRPDQQQILALDAAFAGEGDGHG